MSLFADVYRGRRVLVTGHTGFKGSWLALWLTELGAEVTGISLDPPPESHWDLLKLNVEDHRQDLRDAAKVCALVREARPDVVFHLAAQSLVRQSYLEPVNTWSTNVMGTAHVLEACRQVESVRAIVAITTDKVYANQEWPWGYRENDRLGGHDPYSASKAAAELLIDSHRRALLCSPQMPLLASARAGNVIGGGDWSDDRLLPDVARSVRAGTPLTVRSPQATRPWQHVLECLAGYLLLGQHLLNGRRELAEAWNFGPHERDNGTVADVLTRLRAQWPAFDWVMAQDPQPHETMRLYLDSSKARAVLRWEPTWDLAEALRITVDWYRQYLETGAVLSRPQLSHFIDAAQRAGASWTTA